LKPNWANSGVKDRSLQVWKINPSALAHQLDGLTNLILEYERLAMKAQGSVFKSFRNFLRQFLHRIAGHDQISLSEAA
jgi:hypothetical protein